MLRPLAYEARLRNAAIDAVISEAMDLAGFGPLVAHPLRAVLAAAGLGQGDPAAALDAWTADRLVAEPATRQVLDGLIRRDFDEAELSAVTGGAPPATAAAA